MVEVMTASEFITIAIVYFLNAFIRIVISLLFRVVRIYFRTDIDI